MSERQLLTMLSYCRQAGSGGEKAFIRRFIDVHNPEIDRQGNRILRVPLPSGEPSPVLWSAHTDTVHGEARQDRQRITRSKDNVIELYEPRKGFVLGADNGAGVYLLLEMYKAGVPGLYVFHRAEERGCVGSRFIAEHTPDLLAGIQFAVAFDRKGIDEVITHQCGYRTCSDDFAKSFAKGLGMQHRPSDEGVFTDTNEYIDLVGECTNVSVGYEFAHSHNEILNLRYVTEMREALLRLDASQLVSVRKPGEVDGDWVSSYTSRGWDYKLGSGSCWWEVEDGDEVLESVVLAYPKATELLLLQMGFTPEHLGVPQQVGCLLESGWSAEELREFAECIADGDWEDVDERVYGKEAENDE